MAKNPKKPVPTTKKHLARIERERRQTQYIMLASAIVVASVVLLVIYGILNQTILKDRRPVAIVNGDPIRTSLFQDQTRYVRYMIVRNAENTYQMAQYFGQDPSMAANFVQQLQQTQAQLSTNVVGNQVMDTLIDDYLIRQEAGRRGITVSEDEIEKAFRAAFNYYPDGTPTSSPTMDALPTSTFSAVQLTLIPPTPTETLTPTLTATSTITPTATLTPTITASATATLPPATVTITGTQGMTLTETISPTDTPAPTATHTATPTETLTPTSTVTPTSAPTDTFTPAVTATASNTPTPFTTEGYATLVADTFTQIDETYGIKQDTLRYVIESQLYREKVMETIVGDLPPTEEQVWALHILVAEEELAKDVYNRLEEGEDWGLMAATYSTDESNKNNYGDLGWFGRSKMVKEFEDAAFSIGIGETSQPVKSEFGWHIIRIIGHDNRPLSSDQFQQLKQQKFDDWLKVQREASEVEIRDWWVEIVPDSPKLPDEILQFIQASIQPSEALPQEIPQP